MKVVLAQSAIDDLISIGRYIGNDNPARAETFVQELEAKCRELSTMPRAFPVLPHRKNRGDIRRRVHGDHLIFYRVSTQGIEVLRVIHGAQDYEAWLFDEGTP